MMYLLSLVFINTGHINAKTGAYIFLAGMMIESIISFTEGRILVKKMVDDDKKHTITKNLKFSGFIIR
ncbi:hypothetical protein MGI18_17550 [Bacillus sp. OVS6]|nr:hypothetical protein MGI18_17550 [Bacillus sp. OVS6]